MQGTLILPILIAWILAAIICLHQAQRITCIKLVSFLLFISGLMTIAYMVADYFTGHGINDAVVFHTLYGFEGAGISEYQELIFWAITGIITITILSYGIIKRARSSKDSFIQFPQQPSVKRIASNALAYGLLFFSFSAHPAVHDILDVISQYNYDVSISSEDFAQHLRPIEYQRVNNNQKNIVYLYGESLERTFFDETRFPGLIKELRALEKQALTFTNIRQAELTGWTIAGMTASQCAVPLSSFGQRNEVSEFERMVPGNICLGDILAKEGYQLSYMGGADMHFAGKGRFYHEHGFSEVNGLTELKPNLPPDEPTSKWGLYDDTMLDLLFDKYIALSKSGNRFGLFAITLDTHSPNGHQTPACSHIKYQDGSNSMLNSVACADYLVSRFIRKILSSPYAENTMLIVGSDHLMMRNPAMELLEQHGTENRSDLLMVFNSGLSNQAVAKAGTTLDIAPTVMNLVGLQTQAFALGRNLLGQEPTLLEELGYETLNQKISSWRLSLWGHGFKKSSEED